MFCPNCQNILNNGEEFCPNCGYSITRDMSNHKKRGRKFWLFVCLGVLFFLLLLLVVIFIFWKKEDNVNYDANSSIDLSMITYDDNGIPKFITGNFTDMIVQSEEDALQVLNEILELQIKDAFKEFKLESKKVENNITYYRFQQIYNDVMVYNQNVILAVDKNGKVSSFSGYYIPNIEIEVQPKKSKEEVEEAIWTYLGDDGYIETMEKVIYISNDNPTLSYYVVGSSNDKLQEMIWDANTGNLIIATDLFYTATPYSYTGAGIDDVIHEITIEEYFDRTSLLTQYRFIDPNRDIIVSDCTNLGIFVSLGASILTNNALFKTPIAAIMTENGQLNYHDQKTLRDAITTMSHYETIYDFYKEVLGRDSFDNEGSTIYVCIGVTPETFSDEDLNNAFWASSPINRMFIGNFNGKSLSASLDILAHEFTHGVVHFTSDFANTPKDKNKANESGALNEAYADIFGTIIENKNWVHGEANDIPDNLTRDLSNPTAYGYPSKKGGDYYFPDSILEGHSIEELVEAMEWETLWDYDRGGMHRNSTVPSHAAYLMYENGAFSSFEEMAKVWYNSLFLLSSYSDFEDCALAVIKSAENLGYSFDKISIIRDAFVETNMLEENRFDVEGTISNNNIKLSNTSIIIYDENEVELTTLETDENGGFTIMLDRGQYTIKFSKEGFVSKTLDLHVDGSISLDVVLAYQNISGESVINLCETGNCHTLTLYFWDELYGTEFTKIPYTYLVDDGEVFDFSYNLEKIAQGLPFDIMNIRTDEDGWKITLDIPEIGEFETTFIFYYYGTDQVFDWSTPITEDLVLEMPDTINDFVWDGLLPTLDSFLNSDE